MYALRTTANDDFTPAIDTATAALKTEGFGFLTDITMRQTMQTKIRCRHAALSHPRREPRATPTAQSRPPPIWAYWPHYTEQPAWRPQVELPVDHRKTTEEEEVP